LATIAGTQLSAVEARVLADKWFTKLHAQHKPPGNSILFVGGAANAGSMAVLLGVGNQEASAMFRRLAYLAMFLIPLVPRKELGLRPRFWLRWLPHWGLW